jgi:hypothetical protein
VTDAAVAFVGFHPGPRNDAIIPVSAISLLDNDSRRTEEENAMPVTKTTKDNLTTYSDKYMYNGKQETQITVYDAERKLIYNTTPSISTCKRTILQQFVKDFPKVKVAMYAGGHGTEILEETSFIWTKITDAAEKATMLADNINELKTEYGKAMGGHVDVRGYSTKIVGTKMGYNAHLILRMNMDEINLVLKPKGGSYTFKKGEDFTTMAVYISQCNTDTWVEEYWDKAKGEFKKPDEAKLIAAVHLD